MLTHPATPQLLMPGQAAAPDGPIDLAAMYVMHAGFRRDLDAFVAVVPALPRSDRRRWVGLARRFDLFALVLHKHHAGEDAGLWPLLAERGADAAVLAALVDDHAAVDGLVRTVSTGLRSMADEGTPAVADALVDATARLRDVLAAHLAREERDGMALVQQHLTPEDWERLDREVFSKDYSAREVPVALGWVAAGLSPEAVRRIPGGTSPVFRAAAGALGRRRARRDRRVFEGRP